MMNSRERRLFSWSNATCAMPLREALSSRRGRGRALGRRLQESRARRATRLYPRRRRRYRRWSAAPSTTPPPRWMSPSRAYTNVGADIRRFAVTGRLPPFAPGDGPQSRQPDCISNETKLDFGQKMNGLAMVRGAKYGARQFLSCHGQAETVTKFPAVSFTLQNTALPRAAQIGQSQAKASERFCRARHSAPSDHALCGSLQ